MEIEGKSLFNNVIDNDSKITQDIDFESNITLVVLHGSTCQTAIIGKSILGVEEL